MKIKSAQRISNRQNSPMKDNSYNNNNNNNNNKKREKCNWMRSEKFENRKSRPMNVKFLWVNI